MREMVFRVKKNVTTLDKIFRDNQDRTTCVDRLA